jgi:alpha-L-fucosidase
LFNATEWAEIFADSGAQYVVLTSKHHEGYTLYPSTYSFSWNSYDVGPHRDIIKELSEAVRVKSMKLLTF